jgi:hypothetical protein
MSDYISNVESALCDWSVTRPDDFFGIGAFGASYNGNTFEYLEIVPFSPAADACRAMRRANPPSSGSEYAARAGLIFLEDNQWPTSDRSVVIFSDEELQYYSTTDEANFINMCAESSVQLGIYTLPSEEWTYDPIVTGCNGWVEYLGSRPSMIASLIARFAGRCTP